MIIPESFTFHDALNDAMYAALLTPWITLQDLVVPPRAAGFRHCWKWSAAPFLPPTKKRSKYLSSMQAVLNFPRCVGRTARLRSKALRAILVSMARWRKLLCITVLYGTWWFSMSINVDSARWSISRLFGNSLRRPAGTAAFSCSVCGECVRLPEL